MDQLDERQAEGTWLMVVLAVLFGVGVLGAIGLLALAVLAG